MFAYLISAGLVRRIGTKTCCAGHAFETRALQLQTDVFVCERREKPCGYGELESAEGHVRNACHSMQLMRILEAFGLEIGSTSLIQLSFGRDRLLQYKRGLEFMYVATSSCTDADGVADTGVW